MMFTTLAAKTVHPLLGCSRGVHVRSQTMQANYPALGSVRRFVSHQNFGLITTTKGLNTSKRHSNNDNSENIVHGVPEGG